MNAEEYAAQQTLLSAAVVRFVWSFAKFFARPGMTAPDWLNFLGILFPEVSKQREQAAALARSFYDAERRRFHPELPVNARLLEPYRFDWFVQAMEPVREPMMREDTPDSALASVAMQAVREVENAGRRQIIKAVQDDRQLEEKIRSEAEPREKLTFPPDVKQELLDILNSGKPRERKTWGGQTVEDTPKPFEAPRSQLVQGWARVATGRETCAWCLMLVSRGPVYEGANTAGLDLPDDVAVDMIAAGEDVSEYMDDWHTGCDCKVVPVFDVLDWSGREASQRAYRIWEDATKKAKAELKANPGKEFFSHKTKQWEKTTTNREAINQLRKMIENGEISSQQWAALQAA